MPALFEWRVGNPRRAKKVSAVPLPCHYGGRISGTGRDAPTLPVRLTRTFARTSCSKTWPKAAYKQEVGGSSPPAPTLVRHCSKWDIGSETRVCIARRSRGRRERLMCSRCPSMCAAQCWGSCLVRGRSAVRTSSLRLRASVFEMGHGGESRRSSGVHRSPASHRPFDAGEVLVSSVALVRTLGRVRGPPAVAVPPATVRF